jgi:putative DNA primase/helicase
MRKEETIGRWPGIYQSLGISIRDDGRHGKCPICDKDNFRVDDKEGSGSWICTCGAGDGFTLLQKVLGLSFKEALNQIEPIIGTIRQSKCNRETYADPKKLRKIFQESEPASRDNLVGQYLEARGLKIFPPCLRYHKRVWEPDTKKNMHAMLAVVQDKEGQGVTLHRTYLDVVNASKAKIDKPKKLMPGVKKITGSAIRLFEPSDGLIGIAEGIETALACCHRFNVPTWATISATMMASFEPPKGIKKVIIFGDNDRSFTGQKAAFSLANRLTLQNKIDCEVEIPVKVGTDFADMD